MRGSRIIAAGGALLLSLTAAAVTAPSVTPVEAAGRYRVRAQRVGPGLRLLRIKDTRGPNRIRVLKLDPSNSLTLHMELANDKIPDHEPTSSMASRNRAIAAINGDYTLLPSDPAKGRPVHTFAQSTELITSPLLWGRNFALTPDEETVYIGHPKFRASLTQQETGEVWNIDAWNKVPARYGEFSMYTMAGGYNHKPPRNACATRLLPLSSPALHDDQVNVVQTFAVDVTRCASPRLRRRGGVVLAAPIDSKQGNMIKAGMTPGEAVTVAWTTGWARVTETIGGNPTLLENGVITAENCTDSYFCKRNPRTGIGINGRGRILLVTVDGRRKRSIGMKPVGFAKLFRWLGATSALNLDGGGSTTMWVRGRVVNVPSGSSERAVGSSVLVVPDRPEPVPTPTPSPSPSETGILGPLGPEALSLDGGTGALESERTSCAALRDPASTGGLLDYLDKRRPNRSFRGALGRALAVFRGQLPCRTFAPR